MTRTIVRTKTQGRTTKRERKPPPKPVPVRKPVPARVQQSKKPQLGGNGHNGRHRRNGNRESQTIKITTGARSPDPSSEGGPQKLEAPASEPVVAPSSGPLATDLLARVRQSAAAVPDTRVAEVEEATGVLKRIVTRALARGRGMDERERKAVLTMLCDEVKPVLLRYELALEGLSFLERLRFAKSRGAVVSARLNLKGLIASLAAEGAPADALEDLAHRAR